MSTAAQQEPTTSAKPRTGDFVWHELRTTDAKGAEEFYTHVVGWQAKSAGDAGGMPYTILSVGDLGTAGLMQLTPQMLEAGVKPAWAGFIGVDDVDAYAERVEKPADLPDALIRARDAVVSGRRQALLNVITPY